MNTNRQVSVLAGVLGTLALTYGLAPFWGVLWSLMQIQQNVGVTIGTVALGTFVALIAFVSNAHWAWTGLGILLFATGIRAAREV